MSKKKLSPKETSILCHKVAVLISLLSDYTEELYPETGVPQQFRERAQEMMPLANELLKNLYDIPEVRTSTYINDLANKVDTILRKNYERI